MARAHACTHACMLTSTLCAGLCRLQGTRVQGDQALSAAVLCAQEACPKAGREWCGSGGFLAVLHAQQRLTASVTSEHEVIRQANLTFRRVSSLPATAATSRDPRPPCGFILFAAASSLLLSSSGLCSPCTWACNVEECCLDSPLQVHCLTQHAPCCAGGHTPAAGTVRPARAPWQPGLTRYVRHPYCGPLRLAHADCTAVLDFGA